MLEQIIYDLEKQLLQPEVRNSAEKLAGLFSEDFFEFCSSGKIYFYKANDVIDKEINLSVLDWRIKDFAIKQLSDDVVLATYKSIKPNEIKSEIKYALRSSIWKCFNGKWKIVFHQGTLTTEF